MTFTHPTLTVILLSVLAFCVAHLALRVRAPRLSIACLVPAAMGCLAILPVAAYSELPAADRVLWCLVAVLALLGLLDRLETLMLHRARQTRRTVSPVNLRQHVRHS